MKNETLNFFQIGLYVCLWLQLFSFLTERKKLVFFVNGLFVTFFLFFVIVVATITPINLNHYSKIIPFIFLFSTYFVFIYYVNNKILKEGYNPYMDDHFFKANTASIILVGFFEIFFYKTFFNNWSGFYFLTIPIILFLLIIFLTFVFSKGYQR